MYGGPGGRGLTTARVAPIRIERAWIGAAPGTLWNPTLWLFAGCVALVAATAGGYLTGRLSGPAAVALDTVAAYLVFTVLHDAAHGTAHASRGVNAALGRVGGLALTLAWPLFRAVHHEHHSHTNDRDRDPDLIVSRVPRLLLPLWCLGVVVEYRIKFYGRRLWLTRGALLEAVATDALILGVLVAAGAGGWLATLAVLWLVPAALALLVLAFAFDFVPHHPHDTQARYQATRVMPGRLLNLLLLGQNYHLVHHLWSTIPWYRYQHVYGQIREALAARGARVGWRSAASSE
jgi:beta-carotene hydroxylase